MPAVIDRRRRAPAAALEPAPVHRPGAARGRAGADLRTHLAARRPRLGAAAPGQLHRPGRRLPAGARGARRAAAAARLPQRLPPPRLAPAQRLGPVQGARSAAATTAGPTSSTGTLIGAPEALAVRRAARQVRARADAGAGRGAVRAGVRQPRSATRRRWPSSSATCPRGWRATGSRRSSRSRPSGGTQPANWKVVADNYLEGYHIPIAHPGLMRMLDYKHYDAELHEHYVWFEAPLRDKPSSNRLERAVRAAGDADARARRGGPAHLALRVHLPEHDDRPVPRPGQHLADAARRGRADPRRVRGLPLGRQRPADPRRPVAQQLAEHARAQRGHRPRRERPARAADARLPVRPAVAPGERGGVVRRSGPRGPGPGHWPRRDHGRERAGQARARASGSSPPPFGRSPARGSTACGSPGSRWRRGVSSALVHYHFETREALLAEALDYSYAHAGDARIAGDEDLPAASHAERLRSMIEQCLPTTPALAEDWVLWVELWLRAVRHPGAAPGRRGALRAPARVVRRRDRGRGRGRRVRALRSRRGRGPHAGADRRLRDQDADRRRARSRSNGAPEARVSSRARPGSRAGGDAARLRLTRARAPRPRARRRARSGPRPPCSRPPSGPSRRRRTAARGCRAAARPG